MWLSMASGDMSLNTNQTAVKMLQISCEQIGSQKK